VLTACQQAGLRAAVVYPVESEKPKSFGSERGRRTLGFRAKALASDGAAVPWV